MQIFRRLLTFLRPYRRQVGWSFALAFGAMGMTVLIPYVTGVAIDAIRNHDRHDLIVAAIVIAVAGVGRLGLSAARRLVAGKVSLGVELDLRNRLYGQLQRLELSFFDRQQTGQLMSRATVDLQSVRFFLGYGLIFIAQSLLTIVLAGIAMFALQPELAALALAPVPFVVLIAQRYGRRSRPALQEVQQRIAELTAEAEENVSGVRVVKAFAQEPRQLARFQDSVAGVFDQSIYATRIQAKFGPLLSFFPNLGLAMILLVGGRQVIDGTLTVGQFTAFYAYLLMLISPMRTLGYMLGAAQRATASGARIFQILDRAPADDHPGGRAAAPRRSRPRHARGRQPDVRGRGASCAQRHRPRDRAGRAPSRSSARWARARPRSCRCCRGSTTSAEARCGSTAPTFARSISSASATRSRSSPTIRSCSPRASTTTSPTRDPTPTREDVIRAAARRAGATGSSRRSPTATTRSSASAA